MEIRSFGGGRRCLECERILREANLPFSLVVLLPIPTTRDNKYITNTSTLLEEIKLLAKEGVLFAGYGIPMHLKASLLASGASVFDGAECEEFLLKNALISARGAVAALLTDTQRDITDMKLGIIGYGRIGREMCRILLFLGADVIVYTTRASVASDLCREGVRAEIISEDTDLSRLDTVINTAPARIIPDEKIPPTVEIMDLASGNIFKPSERLTKLSSIPEKMYPITAGRLYAEAIIGYGKGAEGYC